MSLRRVMPVVIGHTFLLKVMYNWVSAPCHRIPDQASVLALNIPIIRHQRCQIRQPALPSRLRSSAKGLLRLLSASCVELGALTYPFAERNKPPYFYLSKSKNCSTSSILACELQKSVSFLP